MSEDRPDTFVGCLNNMVEWLDTVDEVVLIVTGGRMAKNREVQQDLEELAAKLADHPELDAAIMRLMNEEPR